jgi:hypothetical protein
MRAAARSTQTPPIAWATPNGTSRASAPRAAAVTASSVITTAVRLAPMRASAPKVIQNTTPVATAYPTSGRHSGNGLSSPSSSAPRARQHSPAPAASQQAATIASRRLPSALLTSRYSA